MKTMIARPFLPVIGRLMSGHVVVHGDSMLPTLRPGDYLMINRLAYWVSAPQKGDVVVVRGRAGAPARQIKRVADLPGEGVHVLGDNPDGSTDSRDYGPVARSSIEGKAWLRYWPPGRFGLIS